MQKFKDSLKKVDVFGKLVGLSIDSNERYTTGFGGFLTLGIAALVISLSIQTIISLLNRTQATIQQSTSYETSPGPYTINMNSLAFSVGLQDSTVSFDNYMFSITLSYKNVTTINGTSTTTTNSIPLKICSASDWSNFPNDFVQLGLNTTLCPVMNDTILMGTYTSSVFTYFKFAVTSCKNGTNPGVTCASPDNIKSYIAANNKIRIQLYFANNVMNPGSYQSPSQSFVDNVYWLISPGSWAISSDMFFSETHLTTNDDVFQLQGPTTQKYLSYLGETDAQTYIPQPSDNTLLSFYFRKSSYVQVYNVKFKTIGDTVAIIGGFWNACYLVLGFVAGYYNEFIYRSEIANMLFEFDVSEDAGTKRKGYKSKASRIIEQNNSSTEDNHSKTAGKLATIEALSKENRKKISRRSSLEVGVPELFAKISCCFQPKDSLKKAKLLEEALERVNHEIDLRVVLKKLQELTKLKEILLTPTQLALFEFVPPPLIQWNPPIKKPKNVEISEIKLKKAPSELSMYIENYLNYKKLKASDDPISISLLKVIDRDTMNVFNKIDALLQEGEMQIANLDGVYSLTMTTQGKAEEKVHLTPHSPENIESIPEGDIQIHPGFTQRSGTSRLVNIHISMSDQSILVPENEGTIPPLDTSFNLTKNP